MDLFQIILYPALALIAFVLTYFIREVALKRKVIDIPNERSSHNTPTPRGGGLAIVICWFLGLMVLRLTNNINPNLFFALLTGLLLAIIGVLDDIYSLSPKLRLVFQFLSAVGAVYFLGGLNIFAAQESSSLLNVAIGLLAICSIIWFINLFNFLDGIDAYASLEAIFFGLAILIITGFNVSILLIVATLGFLFWNWPKAKIFMGDVGSTQLGFVLIVIGIYLHNNGVLNCTFWLCLTSLFWFDASITLFRRFLNKEQLSVAHRKHAYQRIVRSGYSHLRTSLSALLVNSILFIFVYLSIQLDLLPIFSLILSVILLGLIYFIIEKKHPFNKP